jgi:hypothetical protein
MHKTTNTSVVTRFSKGKKIVLQVLLLEEIASIIWQGQFGNKEKKCLFCLKAITYRFRWI